MGYTVFINLKAIITKSEDAMIYNWSVIKALRPQQNNHRFADNIFILLNKNCCIVDSEFTFTEIVASIVYNKPLSKPNLV